MMMDSNRIVAATCPECATISKEKLNIFRFSGKKDVKGFCCEDGCGVPLWSIHGAKDKYKISVKCPACEELHTYTISKRNFWGKKYFTLNCPTWEVGIFYVGDDEKYIDEQMDIQDDSISDMLSGFMNLDDNFVLMYELIECINDIAKADNVRCSCENPDVTMHIDGDKVVLDCKNCGNQKIILPTEKNINDLLSLGTIVLDDIK